MKRTGTPVRTHTHTLQTETIKIHTAKCLDFEHACMQSMHACIHESMHACMHACIHGEKERETERETETEKERLTQPT